MKRIKYFAFAVMVLCMTLVSAAPSQALDIGDCKVLALNLNNGWENEALNTLGIPYTFVTPTTFQSIDLTQYDVLYVGSTFRNGSVTIASQDALDVLNYRADDIFDFTVQGGGVVALSEPIGQGNWAWTPVPVVPVGGLHYNYVTIENTWHPVNGGLSTSALSNWGSSFHNYFSSYDPSLVMLSSAFGYPVSLAGIVGGGKVFFTGQDADFHRGHYGARLLLGNAITWACEKIVITVDIDIKPGGYPNCFNNNGKGALPVAIFGSDEFVAEDIDPASLELEGLAVKTVGKLNKLLAHYEDVDGDGYTDLVVQFDDTLSTIAPDAESATLTGALYSGVPITGSDSICLVP